MTSPRDARPVLKASALSGRIALDSPLCFFGMGELMRSCFDQLVLACGRTPDLISDNAAAGWGQTYRGIPVVPPEHLRACAASGPTVIITIKQYEYVYEQLAGFGISKVLVADYERSLFRMSGLREILGREPQEADVEDRGHATDQLAGRWALVTGAARGLGAEIARALADSGAHVLLHGRRTESLSDVLAYCLNRGVKAMAVAVDLSDIPAVESLGLSIGSNLPEVDFLINNAAISPPTNLVDLPYATTELFEGCMRVNALAPIALTNRLLPRMLQRGRGRVVNITSSIRGKPSALHYACSKAALDKYVTDLYETLQGSGVSISMVDPGWLRTPMTDFKGLHDAGSAINGVLLPLLLDLNGCWVSAQDFSAMTLQSALMKARQIFPPLSVMQEAR